MGNPISGAMNALGGLAQNIGKVFAGPPARRDQFPETVGSPPSGQGADPRSQFPKTVGDQAHVSGGGGSSSLELK
ncbi:MAG: hypothetical protein VKS61_00715 [Candidatus Sericytochromatia bacterium]|nr:hypothetical protein [Candidatus Sericytochromatia bacterium]